MIVISVTSCPPKLRGDLSKWFMEINTGLYVGNVSARVREAIWKRITESLRDGQAVMVYSANNEQGMICLVHHTGRKPADYDGYTLMKLPDPNKVQPSGVPYSSLEQLRRMGKRKPKPKVKLPEEYVILDLETTGLSPDKDQIIEIGVMQIFQKTVKAEHSWLIRCGSPIPAEIQALTGITDAVIQTEAVPLSDALNEVYDLLDGAELICWHAAFDIAFLEHAFEQNQFVLPDYHFSDAELLVRKNIRDLSNCKMETAAAYFGINTPQQHRALPDCRMLYGILCKLNEII